MNKYIFREYDPDYRSWFALEKKRLIKSMGSLFRIEHVGSTAIVGLGGKGILDVAVGVPTSKMATIKKKLTGAGYEFREKASYMDRLFFRKDYFFKKEKRRVHVHITAFGGRDWRRLIGFRDYLSAHPEAVKKYILIKKEGVKKARGEGTVYKKHKEEFILSILRRVGGGS